MIITGNGVRRAKRAIKEKAGLEVRPAKSQNEPGPKAEDHGLNFSVGVGADFAVEVDFFVLRCGPFHG